MLLEIFGASLAEIVKFKKERLLKKMLKNGKKRCINFFEMTLGEQFFKSLICIFLTHLVHFDKIMTFGQLQHVVWSSKEYIQLQFLSVFLRLCCIATDMKNIICKFWNVLTKVLLGLLF